MLRRSFFYAALLLFVPLGTVYLHYGLLYSWTFAGKIAADFVVPIAMGWAGGYLAAEVKEGREKKLWQIVFGLLAIFGIVVSFLVERQLDEDHIKEMANLREGIRNDFTGAMLKYNEQHPQHPVTSDQFLAMEKSLSEIQNRTASANAIPPTPLTTLGQPTLGAAPLGQPAVPAAQLGGNQPQKIAPVILSAPSTLSGGEIKGTRFGFIRGSIYLHPRIKPSRTTTGTRNPDQLIAATPSLNDVPLDDSFIQSWGDTSIQLKMPDNFGFLKEICEFAKTHGTPTPNTSDVEIGFQVRTFAEIPIESLRSNWVFSSAAR